MPRDDGDRLHDDEQLTPAGPVAIQHGPEGRQKRPKSGSFASVAESLQLLAESKILGRGCRVCQPDYVSRRGWRPYRSPVRLA